MILMPGEFQHDNAKCHDAEHNTDICKHPVFFFMPKTVMMMPSMKKTIPKIINHMRTKAPFTDINPSVAYLDGPGCDNIKKPGIRPA